MTSRAPALAEQDSLPGRRIAGRLLFDNGPAEAPDITHQLPDLVGEHYERWHLGARNTLADILKDLRVLAAVQKVACGKRRPPPAARIAPVADLAGLIVKFPAGGRCFRIAGQ